MTFSKDKAYGGAADGLVPRNHMVEITIERDYTFSQERQRYPDICRLHEFILMSEDIVHGSRIRGVQSRGLG
jgi:hypothetical protein